LTGSGSSAAVFSGRYFAAMWGRPKGRPAFSPAAEKGEGIRFIQIIQCKGKKMFKNDFREAMVTNRWMLKCVLSSLAFFFCMISICFATSPSPGIAAGNHPLDLLQAPALLSDKAVSSVLMDVCHIDDRLIVVGERGHILYSDDSGRTWIQAQVPVSVTLTAVAFPSRKKGWAVGHDGAIVHSQDGGMTWKRQIDGAAINQLMLAKLEPLIHKYKQGLAIADEQQRTDIESTLENLEFFLDDVKMAVEEGPTQPLMDVWFKNEREGIVIGAFGVLLRTIDGGENWVSLVDRIDNPDGFHYYGICRSGNALFIAGEAGMLFRSDDWGQSWNRLESTYEGSFFGITGSDDGSVVAAFGLRGSLFLSYDNGKRWDRAQHRKKASISAGSFFSDETLYLVCVDGSILQSRDKGKTYQMLAERFPGSMSVTESNKNQIVITGLRGVMRLTNDQ
jgi:photosystem II stability/assembly factor-like uncharacterized protein